MGFRVLLLILTICCSSIVSLGQNSLSKETVDSLINVHYQNKNYVSALTIIDDYVESRQELQHYDEAFEYAVKNCILLNEHYNYFTSKGLTLPMYYIYWKRACQMGISAGFAKDVINTFRKFLSQMEKIAPEEIPDFAYTVSFAWLDNTNKDFPEFKDSIFLLQKALDIIKKLPPTLENVRKYVSMCNTFNSNRMYCSLSGNILIEDKMNDCDEWFYNNKAFIDSLDPTEFKKFINDYYTSYCDILLLRATSYASQRSDHIKSIELYNQCISILNNIPIKNDSINVKLALYNSMLGSNYLVINHLSQAKQYINEAHKVILNCVHPDNTNDKLYIFDYCSVLNNIATNYYFIHNNELARTIKEKELNIKRRINSFSSISDSITLMLYCYDDPTRVIAIGQELAKNNSSNDPRMCDVYLLLGEAYTRMMFLGMRDNDRKSANTYDSCVISSFKEVEYCIEKNKEYLDKYKLTQNLYYKLNQNYSLYYTHKDDLEKALQYRLNAVQISGEGDFFFWGLSSQLGEENNIRQYLPSFYKSQVQSIREMLPVLGSVEADTYLQNGAHALYHISEVSSWIPEDSTCQAIGYSTALLEKGLSLEYCSLVSASKENQSLRNSIDSLHKTRDSIFLIENRNDRLIALLNYEKKESKTRGQMLPELEKSLYSTWGDVQEALNDNEIAIEIVSYQTSRWIWSTDSSYIQYDALIVDRQHNRPIRVPLFKQEELIHVYDNQPFSYSQPAGYKLNNSLWGKLAPYIKGKDKVFIAPVGILNLINFECLMDDEGMSANEKYHICRLSSTRQLISRYNDVPHLGTAVVYGGINYKDEGQYQNLQLDSINTRSNWSYLSNTLVEAQGISKTLKNQGSIVDLYTGNNATELRFKLSSKLSPDIIHLSTHGFFIPSDKREILPYYKDSKEAQYIVDDLFYEGLAFAHGESTWKNGTFSLEANDGVLSAYEISKLNLSNTDLVVLSACETAIGERKYDGIIGLQRAFKLAGVNTIIMSLWEVDDLATSFFMKDFYQSLVVTNSKREAFNHAIKATREKFEDPYYWAAFVMLD